MSDTVITTSLIKLRVASTDRFDMPFYFTASLKNPKFDTESDTMITQINSINASLQGGLANLWYADSKTVDFAVKKITRAELFDQTKTTSADGKVVTIASRLQEIFEDPLE